MDRRLRFYLILVSLIVIPSVAHSRPTKEEKSARRSAFWGMLADIYRARSCLARQEEADGCAQRALRDAIGHAPKIDQVKADPNHRFLTELDDISQMIVEKNQTAHERLTRLIDDLMHEFAENTAPVLQPSEDMGKTMFQQYCSSCHGNGKDGLGKLSSQLRYPPKSFTSDDRFTTQFPFGVYAVMIHGVEGGEMTSLLEVLSVDELWAIAFYITSLPYSDSERQFPNDLTSSIKEHAATFALSTLATSTDEDLRNLILKIRPNCGTCKEELAYLRTVWPWSGETGRLAEVALNPRKQAESRALLLLLSAIVLVSGGFIFVLKRSGKVEK